MLTQVNVACEEVDARNQCCNQACELGESFAHEK